MKYIVPALVFIGVAVGLGYYMLLTGPTMPEPSNDSQAESSQSTSTTPESQTDSTERQATAGTASIQSLYTGGESLECAITYIPNPVEPEVAGTIFTHANQLRGDFIVPSPDMTGQIVTSIIIDDTTIWSWTDIEGEIIGSQQPRTDDLTVLERLIAPVGLVKDVQYNCLMWPEVDRTVFVPPSTVLFTDVAAAQTETGILYPEGDF